VVPGRPRVGPGNSHLSHPLQMPYRLSERTADVLIINIRPRPMRIQGVHQFCVLPGFSVWKRYSLYRFNRVSACPYNTSCTERKITTVSRVLRNTIPAIIMV
jgi:hypothetical protein